MANFDKNLFYNEETGILEIGSEIIQERLIVLPKNFIPVLQSELIETVGKPTLKIVMRNLLKILKYDPKNKTTNEWGSLEQYNDERILPVGISSSNIPNKFATWNGKSRNLILRPNIETELWTTKSLTAFKDSLEDILTTNGALAILNIVCKKAGLAFAEQFVKVPGGGNSIAPAQLIKEIFQISGPTFGWNIGEIKTKIGNDENMVILYKNINSFEVREKKMNFPLCSISTGFINGVLNSYFSHAANKSTEAREVKCLGKGDDHCLMVFRSKNTGSLPLDWKDIEFDWKAGD